MGKERKIIIKTLAPIWTGNTDRKVIKQLKEKDIEVYPGAKKMMFSILYTQHNNIVKDGV